MTDLNGNNPMMKNNSLRYLAEGLMERGIASVRFDKRGIGKSKMTDLKESELRFEDFVEDVNRIIQHYREEGYEHIYILGHSEGSLIGMLSAAESKVDGFVSLAGAGKAIDVILQEQLQSNLPSSLLKNLVWY
ncbi:alpha/beta hydrolase [Jiulongibacter sp. NS-SX5]|uniref:alpha/beta hydrolase n=1 Tax=Jiulongibacter sp. NS-SX5 TaxID=3463854 RepID=UPI00405A3FEC